MASQCSDSYEKMSVIRGHHIYKSIRTPIIGEELVLEAQDDNEHDKHAVGVMKDGCVIGHVPRSIHVAINRHAHTYVCAYVPRPRRLLALQPNLPPACKRGRHLFKGGVYSRKYGMYIPSLFIPEGLLNVCISIDGKR